MYRSLWEYEGVSPLLEKPLYSQQSEQQQKIVSEGQINCTAVKGSNCRGFFFAGPSGPAREAWACWLPRGITSLPSVLSFLARCLCHVFGLPVHIPLAIRYGAAEAGEMCRPPNACQMSPRRNVQQTAGTSELPQATAGEDPPRAWAGIPIRCDSRVGMDLARDLSGSVPVYSWGFLFLFGCQNGAFFMCPSNCRMMGNLLTLNYFDIC